MRHRRSSSPGSLAAVCLLLAGSAHRAAAHPYPKDDLHAAGFGYLLPRQCAQYCGVDNQYCCSAGSTCYTSNGIAGCSTGGGGGGGYQFWTTTWTLTQTFTSTYSSPVPAVTGGTCNPNTALGEKPCGSVCCKLTQYCAYNGQCLDGDGSGGGVVGGGGSIVTWPTTITSGGAVITTVFTTQYSAPYRVTSGGTAVVTGTVASATTTSTGVTPGGTAGGGLSPGAIAGIVIGTLAGIALLVLICLCCVVRGLWHGILAIFGLGGSKKKSETIIEEERYTRRGSTHSRRDAHGSWYGGGGGRPSAAGSRKEKKSGGGGLLGIGAALGTLWLLLGLRKDNKKKEASRRARSDVSSSYWSSDYTGDSPSSLSSDRRTRRSHRSGGTRVTRTETRVMSRGPSRAPSHRGDRSPRSPPR
ncbi:hypothetical protein B0H66DRAFT_597899 [Apodospora peruviana]|uniref:Uncharacterized protein n=1 Tax=Apodospora peruviana TaxID=516989 RepID=A0AAE0MF79_9PEZI|nr:hypothetical protein B0H66DRAFT_597899 [Apodospora peruviana]